MGTVERTAFLLLPNSKFGNHISDLSHFARPWRGNRKNMAMIPSDLSVRKEYQEECLRAVQSALRTIKRPQAVFYSPLILLDSLFPLYRPVQCSLALRKKV